MKVRNISFILLLMLSTVNLSYAKEIEAPAWYLNMPLQENQIIGYGSHKNLENARTTARKNIAQQIEVRIISENEFSSSETNGVLEEQAEILIKEQTDLLLESVIIVKEEQKSGLWYVAASYDNSPLIMKLSRRLAQYRDVREPQSSYLKKTRLFQNLERELNAGLDVRLSRSNQHWWLTYRDVAFTLSDFDIEQLLVAETSPEIALTCSAASPMREGTRFNLQAAVSKDGYYSLFDVYENGKVFVLAENVRLDAGEILQFPAADEELELNAGLIVQGKATEDLFVCVYSDKALDLSRFTGITGDIRNAEFEFKLHELIPILDSHDFSSILIRTYPAKQ